MMFKEGVVLIVELAIIHVINSQSVVVTVQQDATVVLGEDASIRCSYTISGSGSLLGWAWSNSTSTGVTNTTLISSGTTVAPDSRYTVDTSQADIITLIISKTEKSDEGFYRCTVTLTTFDGDNDFGKLTVQYEPKCHLPDYIHAYPGENVAITSNCTANPPDINYQWSSVPNVTDLNSDQAIFTFTVSTIVGTNYTVTMIANNSIGSTTESVIVVVADTTTIIPTTTCTTLSPSPTDMPDVIFKVHNVDQSENSVDRRELQSVKFEGTSDSAQSMKIMKDGKEIKSVNSNNIIFTISSVSKGDAGRYKCKASNIAGTSTSNEIRLEVLLAVWKIVVSVIGSVVGGFAVCVGGYYYYSSAKAKKSKTPKDPTSDPVVPQDDVEMKQPDTNSELKRYATSGGDLYTQVSLKDKKKKPDTDNESNKPTAVDLNVEGLQYADLDLTRNLPTDKKDVIHHPEPETMYSSIQTQRI